MRRYLSFVVTVLVVMLLLPGAAVAKNVKVDVCHLTGNGSFHLINVSEKALPAHLGHGDALPGDAVPAMPGYVFSETCQAVEDAPAPEVAVTGEFFNEAGTTVADERGLTFTYQGETWTDPEKLYAEEFWGEYPLYLPESDVALGVTVENLGTTTEQLTIRADLFALAYDGGRALVDVDFGSHEFTLAPGAFYFAPFVGVLPDAAKALYVLEVSLYVGDPADGQLLTHLDMVFCPPELS